LKHQVVVTFDMDGVIVDTITPLFNLYLRILSDYGVTGDRAGFERLNGCNLDEIVSWLMDTYSLHTFKNELYTKFKEGFANLYDEVQLCPGVMQLLDELKEQNVKINLASSASRKSIDTVLATFSLREYFSYIVSGDDVAKAKPDPEIYSKVKARYSSIEHFVIEDSANGILAASRAGLIPIHYAPDVTENHQRICFYRISKLIDALSIVNDQRALVLAQGSELDIENFDEPMDLQMADETKIEALWQQAIKVNPSLFDDLIKSYKGHTVAENGKIVVSSATVAYRKLYAGLMDAELPKYRALAVSAIAQDKNGNVLLGKRGSQVSEYPGYWETVPSGGLPAQNQGMDSHRAQSIIEFNEETGLATEGIESYNVLGLIYDREHQVIDIVAHIALREVIDPDQLKSDEYEQFVLCSAKDLSTKGSELPMIPGAVIIGEMLNVCNNP